MKRIKILMLVPVWRRPGILLIFLRHLKRNLPDYAELLPLFIISPEDPELEKVSWLLKGSHVLNYKNEPLGAKMNAGVSYAVRNFQFDYLMNIGSDNIFTGLLWELYRPYFEIGNKFFGINDFHCMNYDTGEFVIMKNYNTGPDDEPAPVGAGRMIARDIIPDGDLYRNEWGWGMDGCSMFTLFKNGWKATVVPTNGQPVMLNIMTRTNLTQWEELKGAVQCNRITMRGAFGLDSFQVINVKHTINEFNDEVNRRVNECGSRQAAFDMVNEEYRSAMGHPRYKNYDTFKTANYKAK